MTGEARRNKSGAYVWDEPALAEHREWPNGESLARDYFDEIVSASPAFGPARSFIYSCMLEPNELALAVIVDLTDNASSDDRLAQIGIEVIEEFLETTTGYPEILRLFLRLAERNSALRRAIKHAAIPENMPTGVRAVLDQLSQS